MSGKLSDPHWTDRFQGQPEMYGELSDGEIATKVRMLGRNDLEHEPIVQAARDRIARLSRANRDITAENERLRQRLLTAAGDDLCRLTQEEIKDLTGGKVPIPPRDEFLASCERFHAQIAAEDGVNRNCLTLAQLVADNERLTRDRDRAIRERVEAHALAKRLADDAIVALAGSKIATPEEGYLKAPQCLGDDIKRLREERDEVQQRLAALEFDPVKREELALGAWRIWYGAYFGTLPRCQFADISDAGKAGWLSIVDYLVPVVAASRDAEVAELQRQLDEAKGYLSRLFKLFAPDCEPFDNLDGLCTQIDNCMAGMRDNLAEANKRLAELTQPADAIELRKIAWANYGAIYAQQKGEPLEPYESSTPERRARIDKAADAVAARVRAPLVQQIAELTAKLGAAEKRISGQYEQIGNHGRCIVRQRETIKRFKADRDRLAAELATTKQALAAMADERDRARDMLRQAEASSEATQQALADARGDVARIVSAITTHPHGRTTLMDWLRSASGSTVLGISIRDWSKDLFARLNAALAPSTAAEPPLAAPSPAPAKPAASEPVGLCPKCGIQPLTKEGDDMIRLGEKDYLCGNCKRYLCRPIESKAAASEPDDSSHTPDTAHTSSSQSDPADHSGEADEKVRECPHCGSDDTGAALKAPWQRRCATCGTKWSVPHDAEGNLVKQAPCASSMRNDEAPCATSRHSDPAERRFVCPECGGITFAEFGDDVRCRGTGCHWAGQWAEVEAAKDGPITAATTDIRKIVEKSNATDAANQAAEVEAAKGEETKDNRRLGHRQIDNLRARAFCCESDVNDALALLNDRDAILVELQALKQRLAAATQAREAAEKALAEIWGECCPDCGPQQYELFAGLLSKMTEEQRQRAEAAEAAAGVMRETIAWISRVAAPGSGVRGECERILATAPGRAANELRAGKALASKIRDALCSVEAIAHVERALADYDQAVAQGEQRGEGQHGR